MRSVATFRLDLRLESSDLTQSAVVFCTFCLLSNLTSSLFSSRVMNGSSGVGVAYATLPPLLVWPEASQRKPRLLGFTRLGPSSAVCSLYFRVMAFLWHRQYLISCAQVAQLHLRFGDRFNTLTKNWPATFHECHHSKFVECSDPYGTY